MEASKKTVLIKILPVLRFILTPPILYQKFLFQGATNQQSLKRQQTFSDVVLATRTIQKAYRSYVRNYQDLGLLIFMYA